MSSASVVEWRVEEASGEREEDGRRRRTREPTMKVRARIPRRVVRRVVRRWRRWLEGMR